MVPKVLIQFVNVPFQITLNIFYTPTPLKAFVLSYLNKHIYDYNEKVYVKTIDKQTQKGFT